MRCKLIELCICLNLIAASLMLPGCGPKGYNKRFYVLDVKRKAEAATSSNEVILDVRRFTIDSAFDSRGLVYRKGEFEYEADFYNEFLISPATMVTEKTRTWLSQSGLFARVLDRGSYIEPTHTLEGNITALYGDLRDKSSRTAVMEVRVFLVVNKAPKESIIMGSTYKASSKLKDRSAEGLVEAFDYCLEKILTDLEKDVQERLSQVHGA
jgi:cholesterol transport system auxiliary component